MDQNYFSLVVGTLIISMLVLVTVWTIVTSIKRGRVTRRQAEDAINVSETKYRHLVETSQDLIWSCDEKGSFTYLNPAWETLLGYRIEEMLGRPFAEFKPPEVTERDQATFKKIIGGADEYGYETIYLTKNGDERHLVFNAQKIRSTSGMPQGTSGTAHDITKRKKIESQREKLFEQVVESQAKLVALSSQLVDAQETERRHFARELHDGIGQEMTAVSIHLGKLLDSNRDRALGEDLGQLMEMVNNSLQNIRHLSHELRPSILDDLGLVPALRWLFKHQAPIGGFSATIDDTGLYNRLAPHIEIVCFRIVQEALSNILKYARATKVELKLVEVDNYLQIKMQDDGVGFDVVTAMEKATSGESMGLLSMEERASLIGGKLEITSEISKGTLISGRFPLRANGLRTRVTSNQDSNEQHAP